MEISATAIELKKFCEEKEPKTALKKAEKELRKIFGSDHLKVRIG